MVKSQKPLEPIIKDKRITWDSSAPDDQWRLYAGFNALIMPRRYGGLCLPMNEALTSGLPVIMSNTSPNDAVLPGDWLVHGAIQRWLHIPSADPVLQRQHRAAGSEARRVGGYAR